MELTKKNFSILCGSLVMICAFTFCGKFIRYIDLAAFRILARVVIYLLMGFTAWIAMKCSGMSVEMDFKNKRQYFIGVAIAFSLAIVIGVIPALCGFSLVGQHQNFSWFGITYEFLLCLLVIGPVEEFVFRVYLQDAFVSFFGKRKWLGVVIAAFLFGGWHIINGFLMQGFFTFGIGLIFGFAKYKIKDCTYLSVALGHGMYDFLIALVRMFIL